VVERRRISPEFVEDVAEWLSGADFTLFFAGTTYGLVRTSVVESWPRVTSKRLSADLLKVGQGSYDFSKLERLLPVPEQEEEGTRGRNRMGDSGTLRPMARSAASCRDVPWQSECTWVAPSARGHLRS
jgi:hypothetical protein